MDKILKCDYDFTSRRWRHISPQGINFVKHMLQKNPDDRPSANEAFREPWLNMSTSASVRWPSDQGGEGGGGEQATLDKVQASIETFAEYSKLKKLALMVVAHKSTSEEIGYLRKGEDRFIYGENLLSSLYYLQENMPTYIIINAITHISTFSLLVSSYDTNGDG